MMRAGLSAKGFEKSRDVMRLNGYLAELVKNFEEYGEFLYHLTVMGTPSDTEPWGWQLDGHHLIINYFVLGDQVVMTPTFMGSEPVIGDHRSVRRHRGAAGRAGQGPGVHAVADARAAEARDASKPAKTANNALVAGVPRQPGARLRGSAGVGADAAQKRQQLLAVIEEYVGNMADGHAKVQMDDVRTHLDATYFAWIGGIRTRRRLLLPDPQPGDPDRVRSSDARRAPGPARARQGRTSIPSSARRTATTTARICCGSTTRSTGTTLGTGIGEEI